MRKMIFQREAERLWSACVLILVWCDKCMGEAGSTWKGELGSDDETYSVGEWELLK